MGSWNLEEIEQHVTQKYAEKMAQDWPILTHDWTLPDLELSTPLPEPVMQFPREQWITYPSTRTINLLIVDRALDLWDDLTPEQKSRIEFLFQYGGRERTA